MAVLSATVLLGFVLSEAELSSSSMELLSGRLELELLEVVSSESLEVRLDVLEEVLEDELLSLLFVQAARERQTSIAAAAANERIRFMAAPFSGMRNFTGRHRHAGGGGALQKKALRSIRHFTILFYHKTAQMKEPPPKRNQMDRRNFRF